jgi:putative transcriptional regulator
MFGKPNQAAKGKLLIANPFMQDPSFKRSVVVLVEHNTDGTVGFVLNHPLEVKLNDAASDFPQFDTQLFFGGPVQLDSLHYLHAYGDMLPGSMEICDGVFWGGNVEALKVLINANSLNPDGIKFFAGYSGWAPRQLDGELEGKSWIIAPAESGIVFETNPDNLWRRTLRSMGDEYAIMANFPEDPRLN